MRRLLILILALSTVSLLAACGGDAPPTLEGFTVEGQSVTEESELKPIWVDKNSTAKLVMHFSNPDHVEFNTVKINWRTYRAHRFSEESTFETLILDVDTGHIPHESRYTIEAIEYIDKDGVKSIEPYSDNAYTLFVRRSAPEVDIETIHRSETSIGCAFDLNDPDDTLKEAHIEILHEETGVLKTLTYHGNETTHVFEKLKSDADYTVRVLGTHETDDHDALGNVKHDGIIGEIEVSTKPAEEKPTEDDPSDNPDGGKGNDSSAGIEENHFSLSHFDSEVLETLHPLDIPEMAQSVVRLETEYGATTGFASDMNDQTVDFTIRADDSLLTGELSVLLGPEEEPLDATLVDYDERNSLGIVSVDKSHFDEDYHIFELSGDAPLTKEEAGPIFTLGHDYGAMTLKQGDFLRDHYYEPSMYGRFSSDIVMSHSAMGAPILNAQGEVIGVHHSNYRNAAGEEGGYGLYSKVFLDAFYDTDDTDWSFDDVSVPDALGETVQDFETLSYGVGRITVDKGSGTGFLFHETRDYLYFITNEHVVNEATTVTIELGPNYDAYEGTVVHMEKDYRRNVDMAIVQVPKVGVDLHRLQSFDFNFDFNEESGDATFFAFGFPSRIATLNIVEYTALSDTIPPYRLFTSNPLGPGGSGSPILDENNDVVGLHYGSYRYEDESNQGISTFAYQLEAIIESHDFD